MNGIIIVNKPAGWTSFDVVAKIRNLTGVRKVGHSGTLDPIATGVLPVFLGKATKMIKYFLNGNKGYEAEMVLGARTDSGDATGKILNPKSENLNKSEILISKEQIEEAFKKYRGEIMQTPPMFSAVKIKGQRLYELARQGIEVKREARKITIYTLRVTHYDVSDPTAPRVAFEMLCSKGTYVRQLVMDVGDDLGCGAYLTRISRTYSQPFHISQALDMDTIVTMAKSGLLSSVVLDPAEIMAEMKKGG
ncbi:MAG TPA: tRNA pseudouridine(55) synthase TruB [Candidatus Sulfotelmatobacter sp.]|nr:tRNA pseudouridine(55) synthase TruB [Candidatus Sulfotelmatobacter sp.]